MHKMQYKQPLTTHQLKYCGIILNKLNIHWNELLIHIVSQPVLNLPHIEGDSLLQLLPRLVLAVSWSPGSTSCIWNMCRIKYNPP